MKNRARRRAGFLVAVLVAVFVPAATPAAAGEADSGFVSAPALAVAAPVPTKLSIKASATTIAYAGKVTLTGKLARSDTGAALSGRTLNVYTQSLAATAWTKIASVKTSATGAFTYSRTQGSGARYRLSHTATSTTKAVTSPTVTVNVKAPLTSNAMSPAAGTAGVVGDVRTWSGATSGHLNGLNVVVQQLKGATWTTIAIRAVAGGKFAIPFRTSTAGTVQYRLLLPAVKNRFVANTSPVSKLTVRAMAISTASLPAGKVGTAYSAKLAVSNGRAPVTYSWSGTTPPGLTLGSTGTISGTPTTAGTYKPTVKATDANKQVASKAFSIVVGAPAYPVIADVTLPAAQTGVGYAYQVRTTGGTKPFTWSVASGGLPAGLVLNTGTGLISGTPTALGSVAATLKVASAAGSSQKAFTLTVTAPRNWVQPESDATGSGYLAGENTITAANVAQLRTEWRLPGSYASVIADGVLYWSGTLPGSTRQQGVAAYQLATGTVLWTAPVVGDQYGTPRACTELAVTSTLVLCNSGASIVALQRTGDHAVIWDTRLTDAGFTPVNMVVSGDRVVATTTSGNTGQVTVYGLADGQRQWQRGLGAGSPYDVAVGADRVFVVDGGERLRSFGLSNASIGWVGTGTGVRQVIAQGSAVFSVEFPTGAGPSFLVKRNAADGAVAWSFQSPYWIFMNATADTARVYLPTADFDEFGGWSNAGVLAVNMSTGKQSWFAPADWPIRSGMAVQDGIVWVHASDLGRYRVPSKVQALNSSTGAVLRTITVADTSFTAPIVGNGRVLIRHAYTIQVLGLAPPALQVPAKTLPVGWTGSPYSAQLSATGGTAPYSWALVSGSLPAGLTLSASGAIAGTPTTVGAPTVVVRATDATGRTAEGTSRVAVRTAGTQTWSGPAGGPARTGLAASERALGIDSAATFGHRWATPAFTVATGLPSGWSGDEPVVVDGRLITIGQDGQLRGFSITGASGSAPLWETPAPGGADFIGSPTVSNGVIYVLTEAGLHAFTASTGVRVSAWPAAGVQLAGGYIGDNGAVAPVVVGPRVIVQAGTAVNARMIADGAASWTFDLPAGASHHTFGVSTDGTRVFVVERCEVVALVASTGAQSWRGRIPGPGSPCNDNLAWYGMAPVVPVYADGSIYVGTPNSGVAAFDAVTGAVRWRNTLDAAFSGPTVTETTVVFTGRDTGVQVLDRATGAVIAVAPDQDAASPATAVGDLLVYRDMQGKLVALDQGDLSVQWISPVLPAASGWDTYSESRPIVAGGRLYAYANDGSVRAYGPLA